LSEEKKERISRASSFVRLSNKSRGLGAFLPSLTVNNERESLYYVCVCVTKREKQKRKDCVFETDLVEKKERWRAVREREKEEDICRNNVSN